MPEIAWLAFPALGLVAGLLAGLLGIGGGIVLVAALVALLPAFGVPAPALMHAALATSLASILITASASARAHWRRGSLLPATVFWLAPGLVLGGVLGSRWAAGVDGAVLATLVGGFCLLMAARMALAPGPAPAAGGASPASPRGPWLSAAGLGIGAVSAVVGIGGGSLTVPLLVARGVAPVRAVGTSSACGVVIALASASAYALGGPVAHGLVMPAGMLGFVHIPAALGIGLGALVAAPWGVALAHRLGGRALARVFAAALALVGVALLWP
jgi:uncharacterized membrane protein YfcA